MIKLIDREGIPWWINPVQIRTIRQVAGETYLSMGNGVCLIWFDETPEELIREIEFQELPKYKQVKALGDGIDFPADSWR